MNKTEWHSFGYKYAREVEAWAQQEIYPKFELKSITLDWSSRRSRSSSRRSTPRQSESRVPSRRSSRQSSRKSSPAQSRRSTPRFFASEIPKRTRIPEGQAARLNTAKEQKKAVLLHELSRMEMSGSQVCRNMSMHDNIADIEYELNRTIAKDNCVSTVAFMKDSIKLGVTGLELLNQKFKILKLQGWGSEATCDMARYDRCLTKLYTRYMRKGSVSPIIELAFLLFGSMIMTHFKNSFLGGMGTPTAPAPPTRNVPSSSTPFSAPPPAQQRRPTMAPPSQRSSTASRPTMVPPVQQQSMRPTMRRPVSSDTGPLSNAMRSSPLQRPPSPPPATIMMMMRPLRAPQVNSGDAGPSIMEVDVSQKLDKQTIDEVVETENEENDEEEDDDSVGDNEETQMRF